MLSPSQHQRYSRQLILPEIGPDGQAKLGRARVLIVGLGGLGSPAALYLAASGVGTLGLLDSDTVDLSNLQRQILHATPDIGKLKVDSAAQRLRELNPEIALECHPTRLTRDNALDLVRGYDVVLDCCDNFQTRYLLNEVCRQLRKPWVFGAVSRWEGQLSFFSPEEGPCYRCLFPDVPTGEPSGAELGIPGFLPGIIGSMQAAECMKYLLKTGQNLVGRLLLFDALNGACRIVSVSTDPQCPICSGAS